MCFVSFHCNCNLKYLKKWYEYANIRYNLLPPCLYALYICSSPLSSSSSPLSGSRAPPHMGLVLLKGISPFLKNLDSSLDRTKQLLPLLDACRGTSTETLRHLKGSQQAVFQLNSNQDKTPQKALYPAPRHTHPMLTSPKRALCITALASLFLPLSSHSHRLIISSSNGRGRQWCRLRPRHITAA